MTDIQDEFYPVQGSFQSQVGTLRPLLWCIDDDQDLFIRGTGLEKTRQQLVIEVERCKGVDCKDQSVIDQWFDSKYLVLFNNQKRFNPIQMDWDNRIVEESIMQWLPISSAARMTYEMQLKQSMLKNDVRLQLGFGQTIEYFSIDEKRSLPFVRCPYSSCDKVQAQVTIDLSQETGQSQRMLYRIVDFFGDVAGFALAVFCICALFVRLVNFQKAKNSLVMQLYKHKPSW